MRNVLRHCLPAAAPARRRPPPAAGPGAAAGAFGTRPPPTSPPARTSRAIAPGTSRRRGARRRSRQFNDYLATYRSAGSSRPGSCFAPRRRGRNAAAQPFEIPPTERMAAHRPDAALHPRLCDPRGRPGRAGVGLSQPGLNACAGGAPESAHKHYSAIDMVPLRPITREQLMRTLCASQSEHGAPTMRARLLRLSSASTSTAPSTAAGTWIRRSPRNARRSSIPRTSRLSASRCPPTPAQFRRRGGTRHHAAAAPTLVETFDPNAEKLKWFAE